MTTDPGSSGVERGVRPAVAVAPPATQAPAAEPAPGRQGRRLDRRPFVLGGGLLLLLAVMVTGIAVGSVRVPPADIWTGIFGDHTGTRPYIVWNLRLPRVLLATLVGMNLALAGAILQSVTRNPLADPHLLGLSAGGALAAVLVFHYVPGVTVGTLAPIAFAGSLAGAAAVYVLAWRGGVSPSRLILAGVAIGAIFAAFTTGLLLTTGLTTQAIMAWLAGGFYGRSWPHVRVLAPYWAIGLAGALLLARRLDVLALGDEPAAVLGVRVQRMRAILTALAALLTGSAVAAAGLIGFVGLVVPHAARLLVGSGHRYLIPMAAVLGGALLVGSDLVARTVAAPRELPVGIVTAVIGAPAFLVLLRRAR
jgi:iron complex transport system permease protein